MYVYNFLSNIVLRNKSAENFRSPRNSKSNKAFTLIEMLIVIAILLSATVIVIPVSVRQLQNIRSNAKARELSSHIFSVQQDSYSGLKDKIYGMAFYPNRYEIFTGANRGSADTIDSFLLPNNIILSNIDFNGTNELVFVKGGFRPNFAGSLNVYDGVTSYNILITTEGAIWYTKN